MFTPNKIKRRASTGDLNGGTSETNRSRQPNDLRRPKTTDDLPSPTIDSDTTPVRKDTTTTTDVQSVNHTDVLRRRSESDASPMRPLPPIKNKSRRNSVPAQFPETQPVGSNTVIKGLSYQIIANLSELYERGEKPNLVTGRNLDPFGLITQAPDSPLRDYAFDRLSAKKVADFLRKIDIARDHNAPVRQMPSLPELADGALLAGNLSSDIPPVQHSIWIGNPLNPDAVAKHDAFMKSLVNNKLKLQNRNWTVVLWTDQSRTTMNDAAPDSVEGKMRQWAAENGIILANIDEVFAGNNKMALNDLVNLERNKGGTGISAAGDMIRMSVLQRFGGMYVDGDKPINISLDEIAKAANDNKIRLAVPLNQAADRPILQAESEAEKKAEASGLKIVEVRGFAAADAGGLYQSCAFCAQKGSPVFDRIMDSMKENYQKDRSQLKKGEGELAVDQQFRAQRVEVILRTGPSIIAQVINPAGQGEQALMPPNAITTNTGTTSWTQERPFTGTKKVSDFANKVNRLPGPLVLQRRAQLLATLPPNLPDASKLDAKSRARIIVATQKSLTTLSYTIANELGRLDLNYLKPHLAGLPPAEQQLAVHTILETLTQPEFAGLAESVTVLRLPTLRNPEPDNLHLAVETLDLLMPGGKLTNLKLDTFSVQDAALEGNLSFLRYAKEKGLITDLNKRAVQIIDGGTNKGKIVSGFYDIVKTAIVGGNRDVIHYLASLDVFPTYRGLDTILEDAANYGQIDTVIALAEFYKRPNSVKYAIGSQDVNFELGIEILQRYQTTFGNSLDLTQAYYPLLFKFAGRKNPNLFSVIQSLGVNTNDLEPSQRKTLVNELVLRNLDGQKCVDTLNIARSLNLENDLLIVAGRGGETGLISAKLNEIRADKRIPPILFGNHDPEAELAVAHVQFLDSEVGKNDYDGVNVSQLSLKDFRSFVQKALVYSHDRLRADSTGSDSRVRGWQVLLKSMQERLNSELKKTKSIDELNQLSKLDNLIVQTLRQLEGLNASGTLRDRLRQEARNVLGGAPDLSQRQVTSIGGQISRFLRRSSDPNTDPNMGIPLRPDGPIFVPGKGVIYPLIGLEDDVPPPPTFDDE